MEITHFSNWTVNQEGIFVYQQTIYNVWLFCLSNNQFSRTRYVRSFVQIPGYQFFWLQKTKKYQFSRDTFMCSPNKYLDASFPGALFWLFILVWKKFCIISFHLPRLFRRGSQRDKWSEISQERGWAVNKCIALTTLFYFITF